MTTYAPTAGALSRQVGFRPAQSAVAVRDRLVDLVERRPGISQAEAGRILNRNVSLTVKAAVAGGLLRRQSREDRIDSWLLFPQEEWQPTDPRNPAERPNRQLWVLELMGRAGRELTVREVLARARKVDQRITRPAVVGALRSLLHNQAATRRAVGGRFIYAPVRGALTRARGYWLASRRVQGFGVRRGRRERRRATDSRR